MLEVVLDHDYEKSDFLGSKDKTRNIEVEEMKVTEEGVIARSSDNVHNVEIKDVQRAHWLGKLLTFSAMQEDIVKNVEDCKLPLVISGAAGSGKTSVALESLKNMQEKFKGRKILYITKSKNLVEGSKKLLGCEHYNETTNEYETRVPEEIEFLSLHEFFEKIIKKDVKGKEPINRNVFSSCFKGICKKFSKYKKIVGKIFEEFTAVITGGGLLGEKGKGEYIKALGKRQSIFPKEEREKVYSLFEEYREWIEKKDSKWYDTGLVAHKCVKKVQKVYDAVVIDEVQDLTESTLGLILKSLKDESKGNFLLCGDVNQVIHPSFFSVSRLKSFLHKNKYVKNNKSEIFYTLDKNYRNSKQVIELANRVLHFKNSCFASEDKMTEKEKELFFMESETGNTGSVGFIAKGKEQEIAEKAPQSINWAVLVLDNEGKKDARELFDAPLIFNIHEAKGLEFKNVILYKFTSNEAYNKIWNVACPGKGEEETESTIKKIRNSFYERKINPSRPKDKEDKSFEEHKFYMNALYVGITRAIDNVYIIDNEKKCNLLKVVAPWEKFNVDIGDIKKEESSPEEWRDMALELIDEGNIEQAEDIATRLLNKKEYVQEIIDALETKGYHTEAKEINDQLKLSLDKDKSEQIMRSSPESEIDIENLSSQSPQRRSMSESRTPAETGEHKGKKRTAKLDQNKAQWDRNDGQRKELEKLEENRHLVNIISSDNIKRFEEEGYISRYNKEEIFCLVLEEIYLKVSALKKVSFKIAEYLVKEAGVNVNTTSKEDLALLHFAAERGHDKVVELLLEHKANVDVTTNDDWTPLHGAAEGGKKDVVKLLLKHRADVKAENEGGWTPLHLATEGDKKDVVELLLEHGVDVNASTKEGVTSLHGAAEGGKKDVVELLLEHKANVDVTTNNDWTPLHLAAQEGKKDVVELLLEHGVDVNVKTSEGFTTLALALKNGHSEVADLLLADPNINVGCIDFNFVIKKDADRRKLVQKKVQDCKLSDKVKEAAGKMKNGGELDKLLKEIKDLLKPENGFKPSLNYSSDGSDENTTIKIAIKAGGKVLQLLYNYAKDDIGVDTEIFKQLERAKEQQENSQPKSSLNDVSCNLAQAQAQASIT